MNWDDAIGTWNIKVLLEGKTITRVDVGCNEKSIEVTTSDGGKYYFGSDDCWTESVKLIKSKSILTDEDNANIHHAYCEKSWKDECKREFERHG